MSLELRTHKLPAIIVAGLVLAVGIDQARGQCPVAPDSLNELAKLTAGDGAERDFFGDAVSISGDVAMIGRPGDDSAGNNVGSVYLFAGLGECNGNATLDICDIADCTTSGDCNGNGVPDECDIANGTSLDLNPPPDGDGFPDECPPCDMDGLCEMGERCDTCPCDCFSESSLGCGNGVCEPSLGEDCMSCPSDCNGIQNGNPNSRFCCGDGDGQNPVDCSHSRCTDEEEGLDCSIEPVPSSCCGDEMCEGTEDGLNCAVDCGPPPVCGDFFCDAGEDQCNCPSDCGDPPISEADCTDGIDEDCDAATDCDDADCAGDPACAPPSCNGDGVCDPGEDCDNCDSDCDSKTNGPPSGRYCCGNGELEGPEGDGRCDGNP